MSQAAVTCNMLPRTTYTPSSHTSFMSTRSLKDLNGAHPDLGFPILVTVVEAVQTDLITLVSNPNVCAFKPV